MAAKSSKQCVTKNSSIQTSNNILGSNVPNSKTSAKVTLVKKQQSAVSGFIKGKIKTAKEKLFVQGTDPKLTYE